MLWHMTFLQEAVLDFCELAYTLLADKVTLLMSVKVEAPLSVSSPQEFELVFPWRKGHRRGATMTSSQPQQEEQ